MRASSKQQASQSRNLRHYLDVYSRINTVSQEALDAIEDLPVLEELGAKPTMEVLSFLLIIVGMAFTRVMLSRLQVLASRVIPESQFGFREERSTVDMIFSIRQLQEKCRERMMNAFIDFTKAFDLVSRSGLFKILKKIGSAVSSNLSLDSEIDKRIANAAAVLSKLRKRV